LNAERHIPHSPDQRFAWAVDFCRQAQLRLTAPRERVLQFLSRYRLPVSIEMIAHAKVPPGPCDKTTIYRTLMLFREVDLVRQINLPGKISYFVLNAPNERSDFLVCRRCGRVREVRSPLATIRLAQEIATQSGFASIHYALEFRGVCPSCQSLSPEPAPTKLASIKLPPGSQLE